MRGSKSDSGKVKSGSLEGRCSESNSFPLLSHTPKKKRDAAWWGQQKWSDWSAGTAHSSWHRWGTPWDRTPTTSWFLACLVPAAPFPYPAELSWLSVCRRQSTSCARLILSELWEIGRSEVFMTAAHLHSSGMEAVKISCWKHVLTFQGALQINTG